MPEAVTTTQLCEYSMKFCMICTKKKTNKQKTNKKNLVATLRMRQHAPRFWGPKDKQRQTF